MGGASRLIMLLTTSFPSLLPRHRPNAALLCLARHSHLSSSSLAPLAASAQRLTLSPTSRPRLGFSVKASDQLHTQTNTIREDREFSVNSPAAHPWPEWSNLIDSLSSGGYFDNQRERRVIRAEDEFVAYEELSDDFVRASSACLDFARDRSELLGLLSRSDIGVIVENGTAFLFKSALDTARRMRAFLGVGSGNALESDKTLTVDLMKYLLSYASKPIAPSERSNVHRGELIDSAVRNLLSEFARLGCGVTAPEPSASFQHQFPDRYGQTPRPLGYNIEMKRGDWLCPRCNFMNFARNNKCLECEEARPKRQLTGGEWECPQCDFFNYGRNLVCLRCDCKRPCQPLVGTTNSSSVSGYGNATYSNKPDIESRLAANDEKAQRWFSKVSQLDSASDFNSAAADEDFPDIMPLRKGVNRFVVSTRKTPLERRLANSQYERSMGSDNKTPNSRTLDEILGRSSGVSDNLLAKNPQTMEDGEKLMTESVDSVSLKASEQTSAESETWFKKVAELHGATDLASANSDEDFPDIMPMRKGENRFVVSKKKDHSLTSPMYKRRIAMEQAGTNFAPFVPFPPDYFAKKDKQNPDGDDSIVKATNGVSSGSMTPENLDSNRHAISDINHVPRIENQQTSTGNLDLETSGGNKIERKSGSSYGSPISGNLTQSCFGSQSKQDGGWSTGIHGKEGRFQRTNLAGSSNVETSGEKFERKSCISDGSPIGGNPTQNSLGSQKQNQNFEFSGKGSGIESTNLMGNSTKQPENQNVRSGWTGKSLEGSAVQEPDPLDMSEEAKAQRWFRRVAQIKDISELSNIPDEDFPSIMPLRKGVNRFVVSKRKTPLERRLTSPQYRRNLPVVSSDPEKKENENS